MGRRGAAKAQVVAAVDAANDGTRARPPLTASSHRDEASDPSGDACLQRLLSCQLPWNAGFSFLTKAS